MITVDVNAIAYLWIPGEMTGFAEEALRRDPVWVAPLLWRSEFRNIIAGYFRRGLMDVQVTSRCVECAEKQLSGHEYHVQSSVVMRNVYASSCSAYDCEYVALAQDLGTVLVTSDKQILRGFPGLAVSLRAFAEGCVGDE